MSTNRCRRSSLENRLIPQAIDCAEFGRVVVGRAEHHQRRPPVAVDGVLGHRVLGRRAVGEGVQDLEALPLVERLLLADPHHGPGVGAVGAAAQRHLVDDRGAVDEPADGAHVGPGEGRVVEDRGVLLPAAVQLVEQVGAVDAQGLGGGVQVEAVAGLVLDLRHQDRLAAQARRAADPVALGLHADDLGVRVLGDLADQGLAVGLGHLVAGLDPAVGGEKVAERLGLAGLAGAFGTAEVIAVHAGHGTSVCYRSPHRRHLSVTQIQCLTGCSHAAAHRRRLGPRSPGPTTPRRSPRSRCATWPVLYADLLPPEALAIDPAPRGRGLARGR